MLQEHIGAPLNEEIPKNTNDPLIRPVRIIIPLHMDKINVMFI